MEKDKPTEEWLKCYDLCHNQRDMKRHTQIPENKRTMILVNKKMPIYNKIRTWVGITKNHHIMGSCTRYMAGLGR